MKFLSAILVFSWLSFPAWAQRPVPPGILQVEHGAERQEKTLPPPVVAQRKIDPQKLRAQADELSKLAQSVPADVDQTANGVLPKDLSEKLKRIEKLAKQLRGEITR